MIYMILNTMNLSEWVIYWDDDEEVRFVLDQQAVLDFYSASSLKQQSAGKNVVPLGDSILPPN